MYSLKDKYNLIKDSNKNKKCSSIFIVKFEQEDDNWVICPCISLLAISASLPAVISKASISTSEHL